MNLWGLCGGEFFYCFLKKTLVHLFMIGIKLPKEVVLMHSCQKGFQEQREFNIGSLVNVIY